MVPKWRLCLRAEPRLWGAVVLDHPKNPPQWRGKGFAMSELLGLSSSAVTLVSDGSGGILRSDGRAVWVSWRGTRAGLLFARSRKRWLRRRFDNGTLDVVCGDRNAQRNERRGFAFVGALFLAAATLVVVEFFGLVAKIHPSQRSWVDWAVAAGACVVMLGMPALLMAVAMKGLRRSCSVYRLTAQHITPMDGRFAGEPHVLRHATDYGDYGLNLLRLQFPERTLLIGRPPLPAAMLLHREEVEKLRLRKQVRRIVGILIAGVGLAGFVGLLTRPITGLPVWQPALALVAMVSLGLLNIYGQRWMYRGFAAMERRSKQRKNRDAALTGRG